MKVVLTQDVDKLGRLGDTINIKDGFAVNYLVPRGFALPRDSSRAKRLIAKRGYLDHKAAALSQEKADAPETPTKAAARKSVREKKDQRKVHQMKKEEVHGTRFRAG